MTNDESIGYYVLASKKMGLSKDQIEQGIDAMRYVLDIYTEQEADTAYVKFLAEV